MSIDIASYVIPDWQSPKVTGVEFRVWCDESFTDADGTLHFGGDFNSIVVHRSACTVSTVAKTCTIPVVTLPATTDARSNIYRRYFAAIVLVVGSNVTKIADFDILPDGFILGPTPAATNWPDIVDFNLCFVPNYDNSAYSKVVSDRRYFLNNVSATARLLGRSSAGAGAVEEISVGTGLTLAGGILSGTASGGDVSSNTSVSTNSEIALFSGTAGKTLKRSTGVPAAIMPTVLQFINPTVNEPAWSSTGATNSLFYGADSTLASPISSVDPSASLQTYRSGGVLNVGVHAFNVAMYKTAGPGNTYAFNTFLKYTPDMTGFAAGEYFHHGINAHTYIAPTNVPGSGVTVTGYNLLRTEIATSDSHTRAVGAQIECVNSSGVDAGLGVTGFFTVALNVAAGGATQNTIGIQGEGVKATAFSKFFYIKGDTVFSYVIDLVDTTFHLQGTVATNGTTTITGTGTKFTRELQKGDQISFDGVTWYEIASTPVSNTSATTTGAVAGTASGLTLIKNPVPMRLIRPSHIMGSDGAVDYKLLGPKANNTVLLDGDGRGAYCGANFTASDGFLSKSVIGGFADGTGDVYPCLWFGRATPTGSNFVFLYDRFNDATVFNSGAGIDFRIGNQAKWEIDVNGLFPSATTNTLDFGRDAFRIKTGHFGTSINVAGNQVLGARQTGWTVATGTATRSTFDTATVTLPVLAQHVKAMLDDFLTHGALGA